MASSSSSSFVSSAEMIAELESKWSQKMAEGLQFFDKICQEIEDDEQRQAASKFVASKIRTASLFRRSLIIEELANTSIMCRIYLSHEFLSGRDAQFPRLQVFYGKSQLTTTPVIVQASNSSTKVFGKNEHFNLGIKNDANPVKESRIIKVPQWRKVQMSNSHTLFLTHDQKLYGCGKSSLLTFGDKGRKNKYFKEPTLIRIPSGEIVEDILTVENGSIIVTDKFVYVIGQCILERVKLKDVKVLSANCSRIALRKTVGERTRIVRKRCGFSLEFYVPEKQIYDENIARKRGGDVFKRSCQAVLSFTKSVHYFSKYSEMELTFLGVKTKVFIRNRNNCLIYTFNSPESTIYDCTLVLDGKYVRDQNIVGYFTSRDGKIVIKLDSGILAKGWVEIARRNTNDNIESSFKRPNNRRIMIVVDEIPGSYGVNNFCCSPNGENLIFQIGKIEKKLMTPFLNALTSAKQKRIIEDFVVAESIERQPGEAIIETIRILKRVFCSWRAPLVFPENSLLGVALTMFHDLLRDPITTDRYFDKKLYQQPAMIFRNIDFLKDSTQEFFVQKMEKTVIRHPHFKFPFLRNIITEVENIHFKTSNYHPECNIFFNFGEIFARLIEKYYKEESEERQQKDLKDESQMQKMQSSFQRPPLKTQNIENIVRNRIKNKELNPDDIPMDLKIVFFSGPDKVRYLTGRTNRSIFELMYPKWAHKIENGCFTLTDDLMYNYFYHRSNCLAVEKSYDSDLCSTDVFVKQVVRTTSGGDVLCRLVPKYQITNFVTPTTSAKDVWYLESWDGKRVAVHRFLLMMHSRWTSTKRHFDSMQGVSDAENLEPVVIKTDTTVDVIENAMRALLDMTTLYNISIEEVVAVLIFFDFHSMLEAVQDGLEIIFKLFDDSNLNVLYWLFDKLEPQMTPLLLKHNRLILMSMSKHIPPRGFIKRFCQLLSNSSGTEEVIVCLEKIKHEVVFEAEDAMRILIDLPADVEKPLLEAFKEEWGVDYEPVLKKRKLSLEKPKEEMERGEEEEEEEIWLFDSGSEASGSIDS